MAPPTYQLPLRSSTLVFQVVDAIRRNPGRFLSRHQLAAVMAPNGWKPNSITDALSNVARQEGPVERLAHGVYKYRPDRDSADWGLVEDTALVMAGTAPQPQPVETVESDLEAVLYYHLGTTVQGEDIIQDEDGKVGFVRWVA